jgi:hypothetical protein
MLLHASAYIKVKGRWTYLCRAVGKAGQTIDVLLSSKRDIPRNIRAQTCASRFVSDGIVVRSVSSISSTERSSTGAPWHRL